MGTTFNLPNYVGELFSITPQDTPFLSAIGGLTGGESADAVAFNWSYYDLRDADEARQRVEGADAQTAENRVRATAHNVLEIHQETVDVSYTKQAATGQFTTTGSTHTGAVGLNGSNAVLDELDWQTRQALVQIARDVEVSFIKGAYSNPATNATARKTRGILAATSTNSINAVGAAVGSGTVATATTIVTEAAHGLSAGDAVVADTITGAALKENTLYYVLAIDSGTFSLALRPGGAAITLGTGTANLKRATALTGAAVLDLLQLVWDNGGIREEESATIMVNSTLKRALTKEFVTDAGYAESTRNVGGVSVQTIETDFGQLNIMLNRHMPSAVLQVVSLEQCKPRLLNVPGKGFLFAEPLAKVGAADRVQIYGEIGLEYGNELAHGKLLGVGPAA
jgi:hypothetical protein